MVYLMIFGGKKLNCLDPSTDDLLGIKCSRLLPYPLILTGLCSKCSHGK